MEMQMNNDFQAIVLAAGKGSRMGSNLPKALIPLCGKPMISYILDLLAQLGMKSPVVVVGHNRDMVISTLGSSCIYAIQEKQLGSGDAVSSAKNQSPKDGHLLIMCGDSPLFRVETAAALIHRHRESNAAVTLVSAVLDDPYGYGRILRNNNGSIAGIAEEKTADDVQKQIKEINGGCYAFNAHWLWSNIELLTQNAAGEYCLTEMVDIAVSQNQIVESVPALPYEVAGVNTPEQLHQAELLVSSIYHK